MLYAYKIKYYGKRLANYGLVFAMDGISAGLGLSSKRKARMLRKYGKCTTKVLHII